MRGTRSIVCSTPKEHCSGTPTLVHKCSVKVHGSSQQGFRCYRNYLLKMGYTAISGNTFGKEGVPAIMIGRMRKFGAPLRRGKSDKSSSAKRFTFKNRVRHKCAGGTVVG